MSRSIATYAILFCTLGLVVGCANDPYSQKRIRMRQEHLQQTVQDFNRREESSPARLEERRRSLDKWWQSDVEQFNQRMPTIGDYVW